MAATQFYGTGRRKTSVARVWLRPGGGRILVNRRERRVEVVEIDHRESRQKRREAVAQLRLVGRADRRHRPAVEGVGEGDQVVTHRTTSVPRILRASM